MAVPPDSKSNWNTGPTQRLPAHPVPPVRQRPLDQRATKAPRKRSRGATCGIIALSTLVVLLLVAGGVFYWGWSKYQAIAKVVQVDVPTTVPIASRPNNNGGQPSNPNPQPRPTPDIVKDPFNVLLIGVDLREGDTDARTDTIIVVHVDPQNKSATMLSIPRDSCAEIPGHYEDGECWKINAAYELGYKNSLGQTSKERSISGMALTRDTVQRYLDLDSHNQQIDYIAQVDFNGFKKTIDALGGINIDVPKPLWDPVYPTDDGDNGFIRLFVPAGYQHMDGTMALRYARSRHQDADYGRSQRQQDVIRAIVVALKEKSFFEQIDKLDQLSKDLEGYIYTTLPIDDLGNVAALAGLGSDLASGRIQSLKWPTDTVVGGPDANTPIWDPNNIAAAVDALLAGPIPRTDGGAAPEADAPSAPTDADLRIEVMNGAGIRSLAGDVSDHLANRGYAVNTPSNASTIYDKTQIIDYGDHQEAREQLAAELGIKPRNIITKKPPEKPDDATSDLVLLLGRDYQESWRQP